MPYRPLEYVPQVYQPNDDRLSQLLLLQNQNQVNRIQQNSLANVAMWRGIGQSTENMLSSLAQYKREAPIRAEEERKRREAANQRGLDQMAGAAGMDETARGELYRKSGYGALGQEIIAKDTAYKANKAALDYTEKKRGDESLSEAADIFYQIDQSKDPAAAYAASRATIAEKVGKEKAKLLPATYTKPEVDAFRTHITTLADRTRQNALAKSDAEIFKDKRATLQQYVDGGKSMLARQLSIADEQSEHDNAWANFESSIKDLDPETQARVRAEMPFSKTFTKSSQEYAKQYLTGPEKAPTDVFNMVMEGYKKETGHYPTTEAEIADAKRRMYVVDPTKQLANVKEANDVRDKYLDRLFAINKDIGMDSPEGKKLFEEAHSQYTRGLALLGMTPDGVERGQYGGMGAGSNPLSDLGQLRTTQPPKVVPDPQGGFIVTTGSGATWHLNQQQLNTLMQKTQLPGQIAGRAVGNAASAVTGGGLAPPPTAAAAAPPSPNDAAAATASAPPPPVQQPIPTNDWYGQPDPNEFQLFPQGQIPSPLAAPLGDARVPTRPQIAPWAPGGAGGTPLRGDAPMLAAGSPIFRGPVSSVRPQGPYLESLTASLPPNVPPPAAAPPPAGPPTGLTSAIQQSLQSAPPPRMLADATGPIVAPPGPPPGIPPAAYVGPTGLTMQNRRGGPPPLGPPPDQGPPLPQQSIPAPVGPPTEQGPPLPPPQGNLAQAAGALRVPTSRDVLSAVKTPAPTTATHPLLKPPDKPTSDLGGLSPRQVIEQFQPKVDYTTSMQERLNLLQTVMSMAGYDMEPIELRRTAGRQAAKKAAGYSTKSGAPGDESPHQPGQAADLVFAPNGKKIAQTAKGLPWDLYGMAAEKLGLRWGGRWKDPYDPAHVELPDFVGPPNPDDLGNRPFRPPLPYYPANQEQ